MPELEELVSAACGGADPGRVVERLGWLRKSDPPTPAELAAFDAALREADAMFRILDLSARLAERLEETDAPALVGEKFFELDGLVHALYSRPDLIRTRWRVLQRPDGTAPGWLTRARAMGEASDPAAVPPGEAGEAPAGKLELLAKLVKPGPAAVHVRREFAVTANAGDSPGRRLAGPVTSEDGDLHLDFLAGPAPGTIALEFSGRGSGGSSLVGFVLLPGVGGDLVAGFVPLAADGGDGWRVGTAVLGPEELARLGSACHGVTAGVVGWGDLGDAGRRTVVAAAGRAGGPAAEGWRAWAAGLLASGDAPESLRDALARLAGDANPGR